jgi:hypothetical protein
MNTSCVCNRQQFALKLLEGSQYTVASDASDTSFTLKGGCSTTLVKQFVSECLGIPPYPGMLPVGAFGLGTNVDQNNVAAYANINMA